MTRTFVPVRRITVLSVAITLFWAPIAAAQSSNSALPSTANTPLLSPAAFARLIQPPAPDVAQRLAVKEPPRLDLRHATAAMARLAQPAPTAVPQQRRWVARHKTIAGILIGAGVFFGSIGIFCAATGCED